MRFAGSPKNRSVPRINPRALLRDTGIAVADKQLVGDCYARVAKQTHGLILKSDEELNRFFSNPAKRIVGYRDGKALRGYLVFSFKPAAPNEFLTDDMLVEEMVYETREALLGLLAFLRSQSDQIRRIEINTQDENFHLLLDDVRDGSNVLLPFRLPPQQRARRRHHVPCCRCSPRL